MRPTETPVEDLSLTVNGQPVTAEVEPRRKLSDFLKYDRGQRGVRIGCEQGVCGACVVTMDGDLVKSCLVYAVQADGREVETVDGLAEDGQLHPVQTAFHEAHGLQCGYCTSGFVMATRALLEEHPDPTREDIQQALAGNLCRCTGYQNVYEAVRRAASAMEGG